jgi:hypothetical protein
LRNPVRRSARRLAVCAAAAGAGAASAAIQHLSKQGATAVIMGEHEIAKAMLADVAATARGKASGIGHAGILSPSFRAREARTRNPYARCSLVHALCR